MSDMVTAYGIVLYGNDPLTEAQRKKIERVVEAAREGYYSAEQVEKAINADDLTLAPTYAWRVLARLAQEGSNG